MALVKKRDGAIEIVRGGGFLAVFGIPIFLMGLILILLSNSLHQQQFHNDFVATTLLNLLSIVLMIAGTGLMFGRSHIVIERSSKAIEHHVKLLFKVRISSLSYQDIDGLVLRDEDNGDAKPNYILEARGKNRGIVILEHPNTEVMLQVAQDVALFTGAKIENREVTPKAQAPGTATPQDYNFRKNSGNQLLKIGIWGLVIVAISFVTSTSGHWSWDRLQNFRNKVVFVEFPEPLFAYNGPGIYDYPLSFYQYKPTLFGNDKKQALSLDESQYQLVLNPLDSPGQKELSIEGNKIRIKSSGHFLVNLDVQQGSDSSYSIAHEHRQNASQTTLLKADENATNWMALPLQEVPEILREKAALLDEHFPQIETPSLTDFEDVFYLNASTHYHTRGSPGPKHLSAYHKRPFGEAISTKWTPPPTGIINSFLKAHERLLYSFGGDLLFSNGEPVNWVYNPASNEWAGLSPVPVLNAEAGHNRATIVSVYSVAEQLFVMLRHQKNHAIYLFDLQAEAQWKLVQSFSLPVAAAIWEYYDDDTLFSYRASLGENRQNSQASSGYIQLLDLNSFEVTTLSATPELDYERYSGSILSPERSVLRIFAHDGKMYGYFNAQFYVQMEI
jgi:hypothetical protein